MTDSFESITIRKGGYSTESCDTRLEDRLLRIVSELKVDSVVFETHVLNDYAFARFMRNSKLRLLTVGSINHNQSSQLRHLTNLESLTLNSILTADIDFSPFKHLRQVRSVSIMSLNSSFPSTNAITSIQSLIAPSSGLIIQRNQDLEFHLRNTTKRITSLTFFNIIEPLRERTQSLTLLTKSLDSLKHITIIMSMRNTVGFNSFFQDTKVLESISVHSAYPTQFLEYAHDIQYFEFTCESVESQYDENFVSFIENQTKLEFLTFNVEKKVYLGAFFLSYIRKIIKAILVQKSVKHVNLNVHILVSSKIVFLESFHECLLELEGHDLMLNGIPLQNVLRDIRLIDDGTPHNDEAIISLCARDFKTLY